MTKDAGMRFVRLALIVAVVAAMVGPLGLVAQDAAAAPAFNFSPKSGPPGTKVELSATGLPPGESLTLEGNGQPLCSFTSGNNGNGGCAFTVPKGSGNISLKLTGPNVGRSDIGTFKVTQSKKDDDKKDNKKGGNNDGGNKRGGNNTGGGNGGGGIIGRFLDARKKASCVLDNLTSGPRAGAFELACRDQLPGFDPDPVIETTLDLLDCASATLTTLGGIRAGRSDIAKLGATQIGLGACDKTLLNAPFINEFVGEPSQTSNPNVPADQLIPRPTPARPGPSRDQVIAEIVSQIPTNNFDQVNQQSEAIREQVDAQVSAPSAELIHDRHRETRNQVCASLPAGAGGCP